MSSGLFQNLPGAHEMGGLQALPSEPWLLPISDRMDAATTDTDRLEATVRLSVRPFQRAANALMAALLLLLSVQICADLMNARTPHPTTNQIADATPPDMPVTKATLTINN
ncbi:hypothetical protein ASG63_15775 [Methylobacterium sp. Leaf94]|uniref:hypothetical protein n=1 Tax=Methylobacterium sp. Leaf94 TaxID=1736250 RepID=UPI0006FB2BA2|nr:hypothetical protein [Methylobacterium sp. Leaf94]KQU31955.1 hypothetical protein ASG63_15775 [Methylobacterium sp. Leaf94]